MSVFAGALGTLRRIVANVPFDPAEGLDALDLIEQRATDMETALRQVGDLLWGTWDDASTGASRNRKAEAIARAALSAREEAQ